MGLLITKQTGHEASTGETDIFDIIVGGTFSVNLGFVELLPLPCPVSCKMRFPMVFDDLDPREFVDRSDDLVGFDDWGIDETAAFGWESTFVD